MVWVKQIFAALIIALFILSIPVFAEMRKERSVTENDINYDAENTFIEKSADEKAFSKPVVSPEIPEGDSLVPSHLRWCKIKEADDYPECHYKGQIKGCKFDDLDGNGIWDEEEPTIPDWTIFLTNGHNTWETKTEEDGCYLFSGISPGTYTLYEINIDGWEQTFPKDNYEIIMTSDTVIDEKHFGNHFVDELRPQIFSENAENLLVGENLLNSFYLKIDFDPDTNAATQGGWTSYKRTMAYDENNFGWLGDMSMSWRDRDCPAVNALFRDFHMIESPADRAFGIDVSQGTYKVNVYTFDCEYGNDNDLFDIYAENQLMVSGVPSGPVSSIGNYSFDVYVSDGQLNLVFSPMGRINGIEIVKLSHFRYEAVKEDDVLSAGSDNGFSSNMEETPAEEIIHPAEEQENDMLVPPHLRWCKIKEAEDHPECHYKGIISGCKFNDINANSVWDGGEPSLANWTVILTDGYTTWNRTTNDGGCFIFDGLAPAVYRLSEVQQTGWNQTFPAGGFYIINMTGDQEFTGKDFGNHMLQGATRSQGFWATHYKAANSTWLDISSSERILCTMNMGNGPDSEDIAEMEGGFWSKISKKTNNNNRNNLDKARMRLAQQLLAAMLNAQAFGADDGNLIEDGKSAFAGSNIGAINSAKNSLEAFNLAGENITFPPGFDPGPADPQGAENAANKVFWDELCPTLKNSASENYDATLKSSVSSFVRSIASVFSYVSIVNKIINI